LWARLQIDVLWATCTTDDQIDLALSDLPKGLDETYGRCLERVGSKQQRYSLRVLRYVYEAKSPLTIEALAEALATNPDTGELQYGHIPARTAILRSGANLIVFDEVDRLVTPAHHSVRKFLNSSKAPILEELELSVLDDAVLNLGEICIAHLIWNTSGPEIETERPEETPDATQIRLPSIEKMSRWIKPPVNMLPRVMSPWLTTRKDSTPSSGKSKQAPVVLTIPTTRTKTLRLDGPSHSYARSNWISLSRGFVNRLKFERLVRLDLEDSQNEYKCGDLQMFPWKSDSPGPLRSKILGWAIYNGHLPLLELGTQLQRDLTMPLFDYDKLMPLHLAAKRGHIDVFNKVNEMKNVSSSYRCPRTARTALHYAAEYGHSEVIRNWLRSVMPVSSKLADTPDREGHTALDLAIRSGSVTTVDVLSSQFGTLLWSSHPTDILMDALVAGGSQPGVVEYVANSMHLRRSPSANPGDVDYRDASILCWVLRTNNLSLFPALVKAGVYLDAKVDSRHLADGRGQTRSPAIFFAAEAPTPAMALAFIKNGASSNVNHHLDEPNKNDRYGTWGTLHPIDLILSRGWTSLASIICPRLAEYKSYDEREFRLEVRSGEVYWLSIFSEEWIITRVVCASHNPCAFATQLKSHQRFLWARYQDETSRHHLVVTMICPNIEVPDLQLTLMMGTRETAISDWRVGPKSTALSGGTPVCIWPNGLFKPMSFNGNPYNIQLVRISSKRVQCSPDMSSWGVRSRKDVPIRWDAPGDPYVG
jgi:ankyrin repeat protein